MRSVHWLFVVSVALFVSGIGFIVLGARTGQQQTPADGPVLAPVASIRQLMDGIVMPAADVVFESVGTIVSPEGVNDWAPSTEEEWAAVGSGAAALIESGNLLMMSGRALDDDEWIAMSKALADAAKVSLQSVEAKNVEDLFLSSEGLFLSCDNCHQRYMRQ